MPLPVLIKFVALCVAGMILAVVIRRFRFLALPLGGMEAVILGLVLGSRGLDLFSARDLNALWPILVVGVTLFGFIHGFQWDRRYLRRIPLGFWRNDALVTAFTYGAGAGAGFFLYLILPKVFPLELPGLSRWVLLFGFLTAATSPTLAAALFRQHRMPVQVAQFLILRMVMRTTLALMVFVGLSGLFSQTPIRISGLWLIASLGAGLLGWTTLAWARSPAEWVTLLIGTLLLLGGLGEIFLISLIATGFLAGLVMAQSQPLRMRLADTLPLFEKTLFFLFAVITGALLEVSSLTVFVLALIVFVTRWAIQQAGGRLTWPRQPERERSLLNHLSIYISGMALAAIVETAWFEHPQRVLALPPWACGLVLGVLFCDIWVGLTGIHRISPSAEATK